MQPPEYIYSEQNFETKRDSGLYEDSETKMYFFFHILLNQKHILNIKLKQFAKENSFHLLCGFDCGDSLSNRTRLNTGLYQSF